ncbi:MAG: hypothetical protein AAGE59_10035 [Cyanobacteria bacterium P01_F01_bin.86]
MSRQQAIDDQRVLCVREVIGVFCSHRSCEVASDNINLNRASFCPNQQAFQTARKVLPHFIAI